MNNVMTTDRLKVFIMQVFNGNPVDMLMQSIAGVFAALVSAWVEVNPFVGAYVVIVVVDTFLGVRLSKKQGRKFSWSHLLWGPGQKIVFTTVILVAAHFMDRFIPGDVLAYGIAGYMCAVLFLEAVSKYDKLTDNNILSYVRDRLAALVPTKKDGDA